MSDAKRTMTAPRAAFLAAVLLLHAAAQEAWHECDCDAGGDPQCAAVVEACVADARGAEARAERYALNR